MPRRQPDHKPLESAKGAPASPRSKSPKLSDLRAPSTQSASSLAIGAAEAELGKVVESLKKIPRLADLVVCRSASRLQEMSAEIQAAAEQSKRAVAAAARIPKNIPTEAAKLAVKELRNRAGEAEGYLSDLVERTKTLRDGTHSLRDEIALLNRQQMKELITEMQRYRGVFWQKIFELPFVQAEHLHDLKRSLAGEILATSVVFWGKIGTPEEEALQKRAKRAVRAVTKILAGQEPLKLAASKRAEVSRILLGAPPLPDSIIKSFNRAKDLGAQLESLEAKLVCQHGSLKAASASPDWPQYVQLKRELGGRALEVRAKLLEIGALLSPYVELRNYIATSNKKLVFALVSRSRKMHPHQDDLIQEGHIGLIRSVDRYDQHSPWQFSTYATWWINQASGRAFGEISRAVKVPVHNEASLASIMREVSQELHALSVEEIAKRAKLPKKDVEILLPHTRKPSSLYDASRNGEGLQPINLLVDRSTAGPVEEAEREELKQAALDLLRFLNPRERSIIERRFGLNGTRQQTLVEIGHELGITRERVRQIQSIALQRLGLRAHIENLDLMSRAQ